MHWTTATIRIPDQPFIEPEMVAAMIGVTVRTLRRWAKEGKFPRTKRIGVNSRYTALAVGTWLAWQEFVRMPKVDKKAVPGEEASRKKLKKSSDTTGTPPGH